MHYYNNTAQSYRSTALLVLEPNSEPALTGLGAVYDWRINRTLSMEYIKQALAYRPNYVMTHFMLANQYYKVGEYEMAKKHYTKLMSLIPNTSFSEKA